MDCAWVVCTRMEWNGRQDGLARCQHQNYTQLLWSLNRSISFTYRLVSYPQYSTTQTTEGASNSRWQCIRPAIPTFNRSINDSSKDKDVPETLPWKIAFHNTNWRWHLQIKRWKCFLTSCNFKWVVTICEQSCGQRSAWCSNHTIDRNRKIRNRCNYPLQNDFNSGTRRSSC
jgi:hypothetical protein